MNLESSPDFLYRINPRIVSSLRSSEAVLIRGPGEPFELSMSLFQLLGVFAEAKTVQQAFNTLDVDIDLSEFTAIARSFVDRGLLVHDPWFNGACDLQQLLNPAVFSDPATVDRLASWLRQGRAIIIPDALPRDFAEEC